MWDGVFLEWSPKTFSPIGETKSTIIELEGHQVDRLDRIDVSIRNNGLPRPLERNAFFGWTPVKQTVELESPRTLHKRYDASCRRYSYTSVVLLDQRRFPATGVLI